MKTKFIALLLAGFAALTGLARAQSDTNALPPQIVKLLNDLKYQQGQIDLRGGLATLTVPKEFNFLDSTDAETVLVKLWGNPPSDVKPLGLLIPAGMTPISSNCWVVTISYEEGGYVKDDDASKINYDDLLKQMQKSGRGKKQVAAGKWLSRDRIAGLGRTAALRRRDSQNVLGEAVQG